MRRGFTLIELMVALAIVALLLALVAPRYGAGLRHSEDVVLRHNLAQTREAIDKFHADQGRYPSSLDELVARQYLRELPYDPLLRSRRHWQLLAPPQGEAGIHDLRSSAPGLAGDGSRYASW